jgi:hypothetical protein
MATKLTTVTGRGKSCQSESSSGISIPAQISQFGRGPSDRLPGQCGCQNGGYVREPLIKYGHTP